MTPTNFYLVLHPNRIETLSIRIMKLTVPVSCLLSFIFVLLFNTASFSQISVQSTKGYSVNVNVEPVEIVVKGNDNKCTWGYNYNLKLNYTVTITGNNAPKKLYTLQGTVTSNSASHFFSLPVKGGQGTTTTQSNVWRSQSDCATATVASMGLNMINLQIEGDGISFRTVSFPFATTLPVKMVSFSAKQEQQNVKLSWSTATEIDNDFFTVERSKDGDKWTEIKRIKGAGNSNELRSYVVYDENIAAGTFNYRIKQTDFDGKASYSEVRTIRNLNNNKNVSLFPIPNTGNTINVTGIKDYSKNELTLLNAGGNIIFAITLSTSSVELPQLVTGIYFIHIKDKQSGEVSNFRYVKI
jgi:hypothetical protein